MAGKLGLEARMTIGELSRRGISTSGIARQLDVTEGAVRYHLRRQAAGAVDGRAGQRCRAEDWAPAIESWLERRGDRNRLNLAALHAWLVEEHDYPGSVRSVQRFFRKHYPAPKQRARRRVETPPGAQAQADWGEFRGLRVGGQEMTLYAFHLELSHSRHDAVVWSARKHELAWLRVHNEAFIRLEGVPAIVRVDNEKTAVSRGAGASGTVHPAYGRYAAMMRFHVDVCAPRSPEHKGKVERLIRHQRLDANPYGQHWRDMRELQAWTDDRVVRSSRHRKCPATGRSVYESWQAEKPLLSPVPVCLPEPFDLSVLRPVSKDCLVSFEGRRYSVPFRFVGERVEVRGCAETVQVIAEGAIVAEHPRYTERMLVLDDAHFEGEATERILPPTPLGRMGRRLQEIAAMAPEARPIDQYAAYAEVVR